MNSVSTRQSAPSEQADEALRRIEAWIEQQREQRKLTFADGRLLAVAERDGLTAEYGYDTAGDLTSIIEDCGETAFEYDAQRRLVRVRHLDGQFTAYFYGENDRLAAVEDRGLRHEFEHDEAGRLITVRRGNAGAAVYRYDQRGRVVEARTATISTAQEFDAAGRIAAIHQTLDGVRLTLRFEYDAASRLAAQWLPGSHEPIRYAWDERGRPATVRRGEELIAGFEYIEQEKFCRARFANGVSTDSWSDAIDGRLRRERIAEGNVRLLERELDYDATGQLRSDGLRSYEYDSQGRLAGAEDRKTGARWSYGYDASGNQLFSDSPAKLSYDGWGRLIAKREPEAETVYRYDDAGQLTEALRNGETVARFAYDHKGRLAVSQSRVRTERFLYGAADELFAVTGEAGQPLRLFVRTPFGCLAEIHGAAESGELLFRHDDERGVCRLLTDARGEIVAEPRIDPFGAPISPEAVHAPHSFGGRLWFAEVGLYYFGARWYDPKLARFLTPDSYTARPDDARMVNALGDASAQAAWREQLLPEWLKLPQCRQAYAYCGNDPVNCVDPNGHWSFGGALLSVLGALWTLPNTLFGLLVEITCLVGEVIRWLVWLVTAGNVTWATPGFDVAASGRLNAFALVFSGGWLGSFSDLLGITFGNVFFVYKDWRQHPKLASGVNVSPPAYNGAVSFPISEALYEHELRHTNQYGWFGPFFHLGLPLWGVYVWDVILSRGYENAWTERDAREHGGF
jgi:RHS repeat-associated protein